MAGRYDELKRAWADAAAAFVATTADLLRLREEWGRAQAVVGTNAAEHHLPAGPVRPPRRPEPLPEFYFTADRPPVPIALFPREWRQWESG